MPTYGWKSNQNVFFIQIDASNFAEFEISEFEISRFDCIFLYVLHAEAYNIIMILSFVRDRICELVMMFYVAFLAYGLLYISSLAIPHQYSGGSERWNT